MRWILSIFTRGKISVVKRNKGCVRQKTSRNHKCISQGQHYDLKQIYQLLNAHYFEGKLDLKVTWFGNQNRSVTSKRLLGSYNSRQRLVKVHRLLDNPHFPDYFISYIVYHEMLHHLFPPIKTKGKRQIHHDLFKAGERKFQHYELAKNWQKENKNKFF